MKSTDIIKASANSLNIYSFTAEALERLIEAVKSEQLCPTCTALARTVMLDQTSHDTHRKPTDEMVVSAARVLSDRQAAACNVDCGDMWKLHGNDFIDDARAALESAHGIREKNT